MTLIVHQNITKTLKSAFILALKKHVKVLLKNFFFVKCLTNQKKGIILQLFLETGQLKSLIFEQRITQKGGVPERPNGADCKSASLRLRWFESIRPHFYFEIILVVYAKVAHLVER